MEHYRSAHSIPLRNSALLAQHNVTQIAQNIVRTVDKVAERCIFIHSCSVNYTQNTKSVKQLNYSGYTNPLRKKAAALRLCRIFFATDIG